jgi:hypothetical protein
VTYAESQRQYQVALEQYRTAFDQVGHLMSMEAELLDMRLALTQAKHVRDAAWLRETCR